jgi:dTDP-glucose 4,6-dehydratase
MKLFVTGGAGFIGANFILYWLKKHPQDEIVNFDALTYAGNLENLKSVEKNPNYKFIKGDITNGAEMEKVLNDEIDLIVHFAAESHVDRSIMGPQKFVSTNVLGTQVLLDMAIAKRIRFHHISTDEVFGSLPLDSDEKFDEKTCYDPSSPYAASKAASDHLVRAAYKTYKLPITITNCSNNFGPYQFPEKFISLTITNLVEGKKVPVYGDGLNVRDWIYVSDHCVAIDLVIQRGKIGETYCVGGMTEKICNLDVIRRILKIMKKSEKEIEFVKDRPGHDRRYTINWMKIHNELGFRPKHNFDDYLEKTVKWYVDNQDWWSRVKSGEYQKYYEKWYGRK